MKFALLILTFGFQCVLGVESDPKVFPPCSLSGKIDLQLIVDSSGSVGNTNFKLMLQEIADDLIGPFDIGKDKTRVSLFKYSSPNVMKEEFDLDAYTDAASLKKAIKAVEYEAGSTNTGEAMEKALAHYSAKMRKEKETAKVCIVLTDGEAHDAAKIPAALKAWGNKGVTVFALGIGKKLKDTGLEAITGSKDQIIKVADFNAIGKAANSLLAKVCKAIPTKPAPCYGKSIYADSFALKTISDAFHIYSDWGERKSYIDDEYTRASKRPKVVFCVDEGWNTIRWRDVRLNCVTYEDMDCLIIF